MFKEKINELLAKKNDKRSLIDNKTKEMRQLLSNEEATDEDLKKAKDLRSEIDEANDEIRSL